MISIKNEVIKQQPNFWNHFLFHPTDAVEDPWGRRILDQVAEDKAAKMVRIYTMFEDIVYRDGEGKIQYDWRLSDLRLDYMLEKGYDLLLAYAGIPKCISFHSENVSVKSRVKPRYKGKYWNPAPPENYDDWEEICYQYTKHNVERYGIETVSKWHCQCFNEADHAYFMPELDEDEHKFEKKAKEFCKLYAAFQRGIRRVSEEIPIGGPNFAFKSTIGLFLPYVKENNLKLDFISLHNYATSPRRLRDENAKLTVANTLKVHEWQMGYIRENGFEDTKIILDEWGAASGGFKNCEDVPELIFRENEVYSAYYVKLIHEFIKADYKIDKMMICLSGQHEMTEDFSGFRNFFTLNFIRKPIYNAFCLAVKLHEGLLSYETENQNIFAVPTKDENGNMAVMLTYCDECFEENIPETDETVDLGADMDGKKVTVWCIDKDTTNPYRLAQKKNIGKNPTKEEIALLREEGKLKPVTEFNYDNNAKFTLKLTANCTYLITAE